MNYRKNYLYAITISPPMRNESVDYLYNDDTYTIRHALNGCTNHYVFYPELDDNARLHWHGIIRISSFQKWIRKGYKKLRSIGFIKIHRFKSFISHLRYLYYCMKEYGLLRKFCKRIKFKRLRKTYKVFDKSDLDHGLE